MARILITTIASGVGQSALDALNQIGNHTVLGCGTDREVYATSYCEDFYIVPNFHHKDYLDEVLKICIKNNIKLVIPGHDQELLLFSKNIIKFEQIGIEVIVSPTPDLIEITRNKYIWYKYFIKYGCNIVESHSLKDFNANPNLDIFPAIVKPAGGSSSQGIHIVHSVYELKNIEEDGNIIQPYLLPKRTDEEYEILSKAVQNRRLLQVSEISIQLIFSKNSKIKGIFISKNKLRSGIPIHVNPIAIKEFEHMEEVYKFIKACEEEGVKGPVNIQGRITEKGLVFFEMNMRFTGITGNRGLLGFNEVSFLVDNYLGIDTEFGKYAINKFGVRQVACATIPRVKNKKKQTLTILGGGSVGGAFLTSALSKTFFEEINVVCREQSFEKYKKLYADSRVNIIKVSSKLLTEVFSQTDIIINFIGALASNSAQEQFDAIIYQYDLVQKIQKSHIAKIINISSQSIYNQKEFENKTELSKEHIESVYSFQKYISEKFFNSVKDKFPSAQICSLRLGRVIGVDKVNDKILGGFFAKIIEKVGLNETIKVDNSQNKTNLIVIDDIVEAIFFLLKQDKLPRVINLGGDNVSMNEYVNIVAKTLQKKVNFIENKTIKANIYSSLNCDLLKNMGWKSNSSIERAIKQINDKLIKS